MEAAWESLDFYTQRSIKFSGIELFFKSNRFLNCRISSINSFNFFRVRLIMNYETDSFSLMDVHLTNTLMYQLFLAHPKYSRLVFGLKGDKNTFAFSEVLGNKINNSFWVYPPTFFVDSVTRAGFFGYSASYFRFLIDSVFEFFTVEFFEEFYSNFFECFDILSVDITGPRLYPISSSWNAIKDQVLILSFFKYIKPSSRLKLFSVNLVCLNFSV